jgi:putative tricarboxylic transport membrane protein
VNLRSQPPVPDSARQAHTRCPGPPGAGPNASRRVRLGELACTAGLALLAAGSLALALSMPLGSFTRMGPGFLPAAVAGLLLALSLGLLVSQRYGRRSAPDDCRGAVGPALLTLLGLAGFAAVVEPAGGLAAAALVGTAAVYAAGARRLRAVALGAALGWGVLGLLVFGLGVPIPLLPRH